MADIPTPTVEVDLDALDAWLTVRDPLKISCCYPTSTGS